MSALISSPSSSSSSPSLSRSFSSNSNAKNKLSLFHFCMISYFLVSGGPFGVEVAVISGGARNALIAFFILPFVWALPQAAITGEMSSMLPDNGGYILWVQHAFGPFAAWIAGLNGTIGYLFDLSLYPSLCASYFRYYHPDAPPNELYCIKLAVVILCLLVNLRGIREVGNFSAFLTISVLAPFLIQFIWQSPQIFAPGNYGFLQVPEEMDWGVFLSCVVWFYSGYDSLGNLAGDVSDPSRTYSRGSIVTLLMVAFTYAIPTFTAIQTHPDVENEWRTGSLAQFADDVSPGLGHVTFIACLLANIGLYTAGLSASARAFAAMANHDESAGEHIPNAPIPRFFAASPSQTPVAALISLTVVVVMLISLDFTLLIQADVLLACIRVLFEFASFIQFRLTRPDHPRDFTVPYGWFGVALVAIPNLLVAGWTIYSADSITWFVAGALNAFGLVFWLLKNSCQWSTLSHQADGEETESLLEKGQKKKRKKEKPEIPVAKTIKQMYNTFSEVPQPVVAPVPQAVAEPVEPKRRVSRSSRGSNRGLDPAIVAARQRDSIKIDSLKEQSPTADSEPSSGSPTEIRPELALQVSVKINSILVNPREVAERQAREERELIEATMKKMMAEKKKIDEGDETEESQEQNQAEEQKSQEAKQEPEPVKATEEKEMPRQVDPIQPQAEEQKAASATESRAPSSETETSAKQDNESTAAIEAPVHIVEAQTETKEQPIQSIEAVESKVEPVPIASPVQTDSASAASAAVEDESTDPADSEPADAQSQSSAASQSKAGGKGKKKRGKRK